MADARAAAESGRRSVHQAILRAFATTGQPPSTTDLDTITAHRSREVLTALHDADAIRLNPTGQIAVAYPVLRDTDQASRPDRQPGRPRGRCLRDVRPPRWDIGHGRTRP